MNLIEKPENFDLFGEKIIPVLKKSMKDLFGNEVIPQYTRPNGKKGKTNQGAINAHKTLVDYYGEKKDERCKNCIFLLRKEFGKVYYKCEKYKTGASINSDWRVGWRACGLFEKDPG